LKILIIAIGRSGSTVLTTLFGRILDYTAYYEPFNFIHPSTASKVFPNTLPSNCVVKTISDQKPKDVIDILDFYTKYVNEYDRVILLSRKDKQLVYESILHRVTYFFNGNWHTPYVYQELPENKKVRNWVKTQSDLVESLSNVLNIPITWYEDLYSGNQQIVEREIKNWNIDSINYENTLEYLNPKNKYRKTPSLI
jgi:hypothetical protein